MEISTLGQYITAVDLEMDEITHGVISTLDLPDYAEGEAALSTLHETGIHPRTAAYRLLKEAGFQIP